MRSRALPALASTALVAGLFGVAAYGKKQTMDSGRQFTRQIAASLRIEHALNRLTFGPRPGDAAGVRRLGLKKWIDRQLHPERIVENPELTAKLERLDSLRMSSAELVRNYPAPQIVRQMV